MKQLSFKAPDKLAKDFKVYCVKKGIDMQDAFILAMKIILKRK